jgi:TolB-like protein/lipopolysaccharide biosynthesis regulator YciM
MPAGICRFEDFELDPVVYQLRRNVSRVHLERIPFELLCLLVERRGELVSREEILERVWGKGVFVDSENAIRTAVRKIRRALNDDADAPRFIVTVAARGYRFVAPISLRAPIPSVDIYHAANPPLPLPDKPSIAVLPFTNMSGDRDQEYFSDGITDDLITALSRVPGLFVIARSSTFTYKGKAAKVQDVGRELGVAYVLEGSVRKSENKLRITAQLVDTTGGSHLWAERYDRPLKDIFALQDEIVQKIVTTLKLQLALEQRGWVARKHTDNLEAYDYYLRGLEYASSYSKEGNAQARRLWEKAVALDPEYAEAYAWLGRTYNLEWLYRWNADPQALKRAFELGRKALALDDSLPMAHSRLGQTYAFQQQYDQAIAEGERAIALDPNNADSHFLQANVLNNAGRSEQALEALAQGMRLNPRYSPIYLEELGKAYMQLGRHAEAIATLKEATRRSPTSTNVQLSLALNYLWQWLSQESPAAQTLEPALMAAQRALALNDSYVSHVVLGDVYLYQQQHDHALAEMERAVAVAPNEAFSYAALAMVLSYMGRLEDAVEAAEQARRLESRSVLPLGYLANISNAYTMGGRYNEARAALQRALSGLDMLHIHLLLAAVYSELGQAAEARAEAAEVLRLNPHFSLAVHKQRMPIKDPAPLERHLAALRRAGLK